MVRFQFLEEKVYMLLLKRILLAVLQLSLLLGVSALHASWLDSAITAYNTGDYEKAIRILKPKAEDGEADANYYLGQIYRMGRGVEPDNSKAKNYYLEAANLDHVDAQRNLGSLYFFESDVGIENPDAVKWLTKAAEKGDAWSQWFLGKMYINGQGVEKNPEEAYRWFDAAGKQNHEQARYAAEEIRQQLGLPKTDGLKTDMPESHAQESEMPKSDLAASGTTTQTATISEKPVATKPVSELDLSVPLEEPVDNKKLASGYFVQLAAFGNRKNAEKGQTILESSLGDLLSDNPISIYEKPVNDSRSSFKLIIGPMEKPGQALRFCSKIKEKGEDCFISKIDI